MAGPLQVLSRRTLRGFDPGLRDLLTAAQMALELGGLPQVLVWGRARLALPISVEEQEWLRPVVEKLQRDAEQEQRQKQRDQEREQRKRLSKQSQQLRFRRQLLNRLQTTYQREETRFALEADQLISASLNGRLTLKDRQRETERQQRRQEALTRRIEQDEARRRGDKAPGRWLISR